MPRRTMLAVLSATILVALPGVGSDVASATKSGELDHSTEEDMRATLAHSPHVVGLSNASDGSAIVRIYSDATPHADSERALAERLGMDILSSKYTASQLDDLKTRAIRSAQGLEEGEFFGTYYDAVDDSFQIHGKVSSGRLASLEPDEYKYVEMEGGRDGRLVDSSPYRGGARMRPNAPSVAGNCTTAFAVTISGVRRMITAGHCGPNGAFYYNGSGTTRPLGNVVRSPHYPLYDVAYLTGYSYRGAIYTGSSVDIPKAVVHAGDAGLGGNYCVSGSYNKEICGLTVNSMDDALCDTAGCSEALRYTFTGTARTALGDSGAPFYANYGTTQVGIRGVHIGRIGSTGYATKWSIVQGLWSAAIVTS